MGKCLNQQAWTPRKLGLCGSLDLGLSLPFRPVYLARVRSLIVEKATTEPQHAQYQLGEWALCQTRTTCAPGAVFALSRFPTMPQAQVYVLYYEHLSRSRLGIRNEALLFLSCGLWTCLHFVSVACYCF
jgi:hypothetical protein